MIDTITTSAAVEAITQTLETMAFISALPPESTTAPTGDGVLTRIEFAGSTTGALELLCTRQFGCQLAANLLGCEINAPDLDLRAADALKELINITCGTLLRNSSIAADALVEMSVPSQHDFDLSQWESFIGENPAVVDAEGYALALRLVETD